MPPPSPLPRLIIPARTLAITHTLASLIAARLQKGDFIAYYGEVGVGKTELSRAIIRTWSGFPTLRVISPSFALVQTYSHATDQIHHIDLYRLPPKAFHGIELRQLKKDICLVEWAERLENERPDDALVIGIKPELELDGSYSKRHEKRKDPNGSTRNKFYADCPRTIECSSNNGKWSSAFTEWLPMFKDAQLITPQSSTSNTEKLSGSSSS